ncbi:hypothetical protein HMPREF9444_01988 [Succinatimonas hippei YIT 12066]|uniref:Uncharacterized protein n=1 Tax=Succinatimonas hippei (strain DSM 22608 / JCM 16073 / KCTC 15190 / YIT 12066) TaxID=762983 RepID=E8LMJ6_SUCHY|nr:hypothetical protein HMPREF9444_01988 [Succinatimonas hippei YIT 12066]
MILNKENTLFLAMTALSGNDVYTDCLLYVKRRQRISLSRKLRQNGITRTEKIKLL